MKFSGLRFKSRFRNHINRLTDCTKQELFSFSPGSSQEGDDDEVGERRGRLPEGGARANVGDDATNAQRKRQRHGAGRVSIDLNSCLFRVCFLCQVPLKGSIAVQLNLLPIVSIQLHAKRKSLNGAGSAVDVGTGPG